MATPLDSRTVERNNPHNGIAEHIPALHPSWCSDVSFLPFSPPTFLHGDEGGDHGNVDPLWIETLEMIDSDLHWLLRQPHQLFWCQCVYDPSLHLLLDSYLHHAPRTHDTPLALPLKVWELQRNVHRRVFMVFVRLATHRESQESFLSKAGFAELIYERYLFDVPKLLDLCVLYGEGNDALLAKMVAAVFSCQTSYHDDWNLTTTSIMQMLQKVQEKVCIQTGGRDTNLTAQDLTDVIAYAADIAITLQRFTAIFPPATRELAPCVEQIVVFYENVIPALSSLWRTHKHSIANRAHFKFRLGQLKRDLASLVNAALRFQVEKDHTHKGEWSVDGFLATITTVLSEKEFMREFSKHYSLVECVQRAQRSHSDIPAAHFDYVLSALGNGEAPPPSNAMATVPELESLVRRVKEVLPHLGSAFISVCLREYGHSPDAVISAVLEGKLPPGLQQQDWSAEGGQGEEGEAAPKPQTHATVQEEGVWSVGVASNGAGSLLEQRSSVFDGDEFDVFRRDRVEHTKIQKGKRKDRSTISTLLDDKSHLEATREHYSTFASEGGEGGEGGFLFDQYDDEYDDTYDSHSVGAQDAVSTDDIFTVQRLNEKGLYQKQFTTASDEETEDHTHPDAPEPPKGAGAPARGRGQSKVGRGEVRSRQLKERHKGSHGNHNRKAMADRKRGKGMGPLPRN